MNYDQTNIPAGYDRGRDHGPAFLEQWMRALERHVQPRQVGTILDLGCGTGRFSEALALHFDARVIGVDPSTKMLERARAKPRQGEIQYQRGSAEVIALGAQTVDMVFVSMSFHHFVDRALAARECRRVLRGSGVVCVRTGTRERIASYPYVPFFPTTPARLVEVLPSQAEISEPFVEAGFRLAVSDVIVQTVAPDLSAYADKLSAGGDSVLATLSPQEFEAGLAALRRCAAETETRPVVEPIDLFIFDTSA